MNEVSGGTFQIVQNINQYFGLVEINEELAEENAKLRSQQMSSHLRVFSPEVFIHDTIYHQQYVFKEAKVINASVHKKNNFITLNLGSSDGISPGMGVVSSFGIVGIVNRVSSHFSLVIPIIHTKFKTGVKLSNDNYFGLIEWDGSDPSVAMLKDIPSHVVLKEGDEVVSRGSSAIFPEGISVGKIKSFEKVEGNNFYRIYVNLTVNFQNLSHVYIVKNLLKLEQQQIEINPEDIEL